MLRARLYAKDSTNATQEVLVDRDQNLLVVDATTTAEVTAVKDEVELVKAELVAANVLLDDIKDLLTTISAQLPAALTVGGNLKVEESGA
jgi:UDP-glucose 4-epimerase